MERTGTSLRFASDDLQGNREVVLAAVENDPSAWQYAHICLYTDTNFAVQAVTANPRTLNHMSDKHRNTWRIVKAAVEKDGDCLELAPEKFKNDPTIVTAAVEEKGTSLRFASDKLRADCMIVLAAVKHDSSAWKHADPSLYNDALFASKACASNPDVLEYVSLDHIRNEKVVEAAVREDETCFRHVAERVFYGRIENRDIPPRFMGNKHIVIAGVRHFKGPRFLFHASEELKDDPDVVMAALDRSGEPHNVAEAYEDKDGSALRVASQRVRANKNVVIEACRMIPSAILDADFDFRYDRDVVMACVESVKRRRGEVVDAEFTPLKYTSEAIRAERDIVMLAVRQTPMALKYAGEKLRNEKGVVMHAISWHGMALKHAGPKLQGDIEVVIKAVSDNGLALQFANKNLRSNARVVSIAVDENGEALQYAGKDMRSNQDIVLKSFYIGGESCKAIRFADPSLMDDTDFARSAIQKDLRTFPHLYAKHRNNVGHFTHAMDKLHRNWSIDLIMSAAAPDIQRTLQHIANPRTLPDVPDSQSFPKHYVMEEKRKSDELVASLGQGSEEKLEKDAKRRQSDLQMLLDMEKVIDILVGQEIWHQHGRYVCFPKSWREILNLKVRRLYKTVPVWQPVPYDLGTEMFKLVCDTEVGWIKTSITMVALVTGHPTGCERMPPLLSQQSNDETTTTTTTTTTSKT